MQAELLRFHTHASLSLVKGSDLLEAGFYVGPERVVGPYEYLGFDRVITDELTGTRTLREPTFEEVIAAGLAPYEVRDFEGNVVTTVGITRLLNLLIAAGATQAYDATHTSLGVGDGAGSVPTAANTDADLTAATGATHRQIQPVAATYPSIAAGVLNAQSVFGTGVALFHWREWGMSQDTAASTIAMTAPMFNHRGVDMGDFTGTSIQKTLAITMTPS